MNLQPAKVNWLKWLAFVSHVFEFLSSSQSLRRVTSTLSGLSVKLWNTFTVKGMRANMIKGYRYKGSMKAGTNKMTAGRMRPHGKNPFRTGKVAGLLLLTVVFNSFYFLTRSMYRMYCNYRKMEIFIETQLLGS